MMNGSEFIIFTCSFVVEHCFGSALRIAADFIETGIRRDGKKSALGFSNKTNQFEKLKKKKKKTTPKKL